MDKKNKDSTYEMTESFIEKISDIYELYSWQKEMIRKVLRNFSQTQMAERPASSGPTLFSPDKKRKFARRSVSIILFDEFACME